MIGPEINYSGEIPSIKTVEASAIYICLKFTLKCAMASLFYTQMSLRNMGTFYGYFAVKEARHQIYI